MHSTPDGSEPVYAKASVAPKRKWANQNGQTKTGGLAAAGFYHDTVPTVWPVAKLSEPK
jgi:hypothetical protein